MLLDWTLIAAGLALLVMGGEALVRGASGVALLARMTPAVVGLTIVAAGTSMPELVVSTQAALEGRPGIALGNVVGSNIFNIGAILALAALVRPLRIQDSNLRLEWPVMMLAALLLHLLARDGAVDRFEGAVLLGGMIAFLAYAVRHGRQPGSAPEAAPEAPVATASFGRSGGAALALNLLALAVGVALLAFGASVLVQGAASVAADLGVSGAVIGLTVVAAGTSAPELVTSLVAARRGQDDIAVGNVIGSNIFNALGILGTTAAIHPLPVPAELLARDHWWMLAASLLLYPLMRSNMRVSRVEGAILLAGFCTYMTLLVRAA